jgi:hypothetical protein
MAVGLLAMAYCQVGSTVKPIHPLVVRERKHRAQQVMDAPITKPMICSSVNRVVFISVMLQNLRTDCHHLGTAGRRQVRFLFTLQLSSRLFELIVSRPYAATYAKGIGHFAQQLIQAPEKLGYEEIAKYGTAIDRTNVRF